MKELFFTVLTLFHSNLYSASNSFNIEGIGFEQDMAEVFEKELVDLISRDAKRGHYEVRYLCTFNPILTNLCTIDVSYKEESFAMYALSYKNDKIQLWVKSFKH